MVPFGVRIGGIRSSVLPLGVRSNSTCNRPHAFCVGAEPARCCIKPFRVSGIAACDGIRSLSVRARRARSRSISLRMAVHCFGRRAIPFRMGSGSVACHFTSQPFCMRIDGTCRGPPSFRMRTARPARSALSLCMGIVAGGIGFPSFRVALNPASSRSVSFRMCISAGSRRLIAFCMGIFPRC